MKILFPLFQMLAALATRGFGKPQKPGPSSQADRCDDSFLPTSPCVTFSAHSPADQPQVVALKLNDFQAVDRGAANQ